MRFSKGETLFLPAGLGRCLVVGDAELHGTLVGFLFCLIPHEPQTAPRYRMIGNPFPEQRLVTF